MFTWDKGFLVISHKRVKLKVKSLPEFSRAEDLRDSNNSFSLLVAIAASSVFLWRTCMKEICSS